MAMRLYSESEFEGELRESWGLSPTDYETETTKIWKTKSGKHVVAPKLPRGTAYPDYYLDQIIKEIKRLELI
jgi:hypothetical protein